MNARLLPRTALTPEQRGAMFRILAAQFETANAEVFAADLEAKNWALLLEDESGAVKGFTTLLHYRSTYLGAPIQVVYSGDTAVDATAAGTSVLWRSWLDAVNRVRDHDGTPLYWLLIVSGFRTYRFMSLFWKQFHPRHDSPMPAPVRELRDALARERFGDRYDPATGVVKLGFPQVLVPRLREIPARCEQDADVEFFVQADPGHARGDELVCLTEITPENLTAAGRRMWQVAEPPRAPDGAAR